MKRDMDLVRKILFAIEDHPLGYAPDELVIDGYTREQIAHHVSLMLEAGLVHGVDETDAESPGPEASATSLTWQGHEFIEAARNDTLWNKAKTQLKEKGIGLTVGLLVEYLKHLGKQQLGLS